jgi:hypothetical protein
MMPIFLQRSNGNSLATSYPFPCVIALAYALRSTYCFAAHAAASR